MDDNTKIVKYFCKNQHSFMLSFYLIQARRNQGGKKGAVRLQPTPPRFLLGLTFSPLKMIVKRKKVVRKYEPLQIPRKLLVTLLWFISCNP